MSTRTKTSLWGIVFTALLAFVAFSVPATSQTPPSATLYEDAAWIGTESGIARVGIADGQVKVSVPMSAPEIAIAVDERRLIVWAFNGTTISNFDFNGALQFSVPVTSGLPEGDPLLAVPSAINPNDGSVWAGVGRNLYHVFPDGTVTGPVVFDDHIKGLAVDDPRGRVWVGVRNQLALLDLSANPILPPVAVPSLKDLAVDEGTGEAWVVTPTALKRFDATLTSLFSQDLDIAPKHVSTHGGGGIWVASYSEVVRFNAAGVEQSRVTPFAAVDPDSYDESGGTLVTVTIEALDVTHDDTVAWVGSNDNRLAEIGTTGVQRIMGPFPTFPSAEIKDIAVYTDFLAPDLAITSPADGAGVLETQPAITVTYNDIGQGVDTASLALIGNGMPLSVTCTHTAGQSVCVPDATLPSGANTVTATIADLAGNVSAEVSATFTVNGDTTPPTIALTYPPNGMLTNIGAHTITGFLSEDAVLTINGAAVPLDAAFNFTYGVVLLEGVNTLAMSATDPAGNTGTLTLTIELDSTAPVVTPPAAVTAEATGATTAVSIGAGTASDARDGSLVPSSDAPAAFPIGTTTVTWTATDAAGNIGTATQTVTVADTTAPVLTVPANVSVNVNTVPAQVDIGQATATDLFTPVTITNDAPTGGFADGITTVTWTATDANGVSATGTQTVTVSQVLAAKALHPAGYGKNYESLVPLDATIGAYDERRFAILTGFVEDLTGSPISGVTVSINKAPEYGSVTTDLTGRYAIPVNGGGTVTVNIEFPGYLEVQRTGRLEWNEIAVLDTAVLLPQDVGTTWTLDGNPNSYFTHTSSPHTDADGTRSMSLVIAGDTQMTVVDELGNQTPLTGPVTVRATEYVRKDTLPGPLPANSAFNYAVDIHFDGVSPRSTVRFTKPDGTPTTAVGYVDNFLNFPVGELVPVGYYSLVKAQWIPEQDGVIVMLLDTNADGIVDGLDFTGDGLPDDLNGDGLTTDEVAGVSSNPSLVAGNTYWRVDFSHFCPFDLNWPFSWPWGATSSPPAGTGTPGGGGGGGGGGG
ncbi:MAG: HYR domain-containing protein, partial [Nitrospirota bacterium]|nr:HYR domain-containing protein [Nitrospirota bacterium]